MNIVFLWNVHCESKDYKVRFPLQFPKLWLIRFFVILNVLQLEMKNEVEIFCLDITNAFKSPGLKVDMSNGVACCSFETN